MTSLPWSARCIKYLLFIFNLLFVITGIILISVGATVHGIYGSYSHFLDNSGYMSTSAFLVAIGMCIFIISFFGCCGAVKENFCMTVTFTSLLIMIFIFELAAGISGYVLRDNTESILVHNLNVSMATYNENRESGYTVDTLQRTFECCGVNGKEDWRSYLNLNDSIKDWLPMSCCSTTQVIGNFSCSLNATQVYSRGCVTAFGDFLASHAVTLGGVALGIAFVQLLGIIFSCQLSRHIRAYQTV